MTIKAPTDSATTRSRQHTRGRWSFVLAALLGTIALLGAACGGDDGGDSGGSGGDGGSASADDCPVDALDDADGPVTAAGDVAALRQTLVAALAP